METFQLYEKERITKKLNQKLRNQREFIEEMAKREIFIDTIAEGIAMILPERILSDRSRK